MKLAAFPLTLGIALYASCAVAQTATPASPPTPAPSGTDRASPPAKRVPATPEMRAARTKFRTACAQDAQKHCADIEKGKGGGLQRCLQSHAKELSPDCSAARAELRSLRGKKG